MARSLTRGGLMWVVTGALIYACSGEERRFVDPSGDDEGGAGMGASDSGGASGSGRGGAAGSSGSGTSGDAGGPGDGGTSTGGSGNRGGTGGTTDPGGAGGEAGEPEPPPPPGRPGTAIVAGGEYMSSANYRMFIINGNGSLRVTSTSANYSLRGGIVGTTQP